MIEVVVEPLGFGFAVAALTTVLGCNAPSNMQRNAALPSGAALPKAATARAAATSSASPSSAAFHLPAIATDSSLSIRARSAAGTLPAGEPDTLVIDGHVTTAPRREHPPKVFKVSAGRYALHDFGSDELLLWEAGAKRLTNLGRVRLDRVPALGHVLVPMNPSGEVVFCDLDPVRPALRPLWRSDIAKHTEIVGFTNGSLVLMVRAYEQEAASGPSPRATLSTRATLVFIQPGKPPYERTVTPGPYVVAPDYWFQRRGFDAIRGNRILMLDPTGIDSNPRGKPFNAPAAILDLDTDTLRPIGNAAGGVSRDTAIPHPFVALVWTRTADRPSAGAYPSVSGCVNAVVEETESLVSICY